MALCILPDPPLRFSLNQQLYSELYNKYSVVNYMPVRVNGIPEDSSTTLFEEKKNTTTQSRLARNHL